MAYFVKYLKYTSQEAYDYIKSSVVSAKPKYDIMYGASSAEIQYNVCNSA